MRTEVSTMGDRFMSNLRGFSDNEIGQRGSFSNKAFDNLDEYTKRNTLGIL